MLGGALKVCLETYAPHVQVITTDKSENKNCVPAAANFKISHIFHCAASVDADFCESNPGHARSTILEYTKNIVKLARKNKCKIFYPQSFLIYDGKTNPIDEKTSPNPISIYGKFKLEAEKFLVENYEDSLIVRMGGFFGGEEKDKNFVGKFVKILKGAISNNIKEIVVGDRRWQPTYTKDLAYNCLLLLAYQKNGIYSMASEDDASFFSVAEECVMQLKLANKIKVIQDDFDIIKKKDIALRPDRVVLSNSKLKAEKLYAIRNWKDALSEYLNSKYFEKYFEANSSKVVNVA